MKTLGRTLRGMSRWPSGLTPLAALILALPFALSESKAQAPGFGETRIAQGTVQRLTAAPMGEIDGAVLDDGTVIHWPPHLADRFSAIVARGDRIRAVGRMETGPAGDTHLEVQTVTNLRTNDLRENDAPAPGPGLRPEPLPPPPPGPGPGNDPITTTTRTAQGTVRRLTRAPMGEIDGAVLDDGTVIHWPPHLAERFTAIVAQGDRIKVSGWMEAGPAGDTHFEVVTATNLRTNATTSNDVDGRPSTRPARLPADGSGDFAAPSSRQGDVERRLKALEDQIAQLREEIRKIRDEL
jgi:hypothetical protein